MKQQLLNARIIHAALAVGVFFFMGITVLLFMKGPAPGTPPVNDQTRTLMWTLSIVHIVFFAATWTIGPLVEKRILAGKPLTPNLWLRGRLIVLATREGSAFFGLVACLLGALNGVLREQPLYWLNAGNAVLFILYIATHFPKESDLGELSGGESLAATVIR